MADFYLDHGVYGTTTNRLGLDAPVTWGAPQEGDGSGKDAATASSVAFVTFSGIPTSGAITVCGVTVSTTGVLAAASETAAANALATNINATTTAVASGVSLAVPQLRNLVYARGPAGGAPAGTCEVMIRVGSVCFNYANNTNCLIAHTFNNSSETAGNRQFAGGVGGCWGWFFNPVAIGAANTYALGAYGCLPMAEYMASTVSGGTTTVKPGISDEIWVRNNKTVVLTGNGVSASVSTSRAFETNYVFDSNTVWTSDSPTGVFTVELVMPKNNSNTVTLGHGSAGSGVYSSFSALMNGGLVFKGTGTNTGGVVNVGVGGNGGNLRIHNAHFVESSEVVASSRFAVSCTSAGYIPNTIFENCKFDYQPPITAIKNGGFVALAANFGLAAFIGCEFSWNITGGADPGPIITMNLSQASQQSWKFQGCKFSGYASGFTAIGGAGTNGQTLQHGEFSFENCSGLKLATGTYTSMSSKYASARVDTSAFMLYSSNDTGRPFRYENYAGVADWDMNASPAYPTLAATQRDGTAWSLKLLWFATDAATFSKPFVAPKLTQQNLLATAVRTIKVELLTPTAVTLNSRMLSVRVTYIDTDGYARVENTFATVTPATSAASWVNIGSFPNHSAKKYEITTAYAVKQYTDVAVELQINTKSPTAALESVFLDPEFSIS